MVGRGGGGLLLLVIVIVIVIAIVMVIAEALPLALALAVAIAIAMVLALALVIMTMIEVVVIAIVVIIIMTIATRDERNILSSSRGLGISWQVLLLSGAPLTCEALGEVRAAFPALFEGVPEPQLDYSRNLIKKPWAYNP